MPSNVIDSRERFENRMKKKSLLDGHDVKYNVPASALTPNYPKERLTVELVNQLDSEGQLAAWSLQHPGEFFEFLMERQSPRKSDVLMAVHEEVQKLRAARNK